MSESASAARANAAIYYHPDGFNTGRQKLMGRHVAGESFLTGFVRNAGVERFYCVATQKAHAEDFMRRVRSAGGAAPVEWIAPSRAEGLAAPGAILWPGPDIGAEAWRRRRFGQSLYSICGVTHTTCTARAMDAVADLLVAPLQSWDALICTSQAVVASVKRELLVHSAYLRDRFGAARIEGPQLAMIPLGVNADQFAPSPEHRKTWRERLGIPDDAVAVLVVGRLSHHGKAHPLPMFMALEAAAQAARTKTHLILCGWFASDSQEAVFREGAADFCPSVTIHVVDGRQADARAGIWSAGDIFTLMSDNVQETFGLAPVEGMAAGMPVVATDWDGFRDTVVHGETGFLAPTVTPPAPCGEDLALRHHAEMDTYDYYIGQTAQFVAFDVRAAAEHYRALIDDAALRKRMGEAARKRAERVYDWSVIIPQYQTLWTELAARRKAEESRAEPKRGAPRTPTRLDPFDLFSGYPTRQLALTDKIVANADEAQLEAVLAARGSTIRLELLGGAAALKATLKASAAPVELGALTSAVDGAARRVAVLRGVAWLLKMNLVRLESSLAS